MHSSPTLTRLVKEGAKKTSEPITFWKLFLVDGDINNLHLTGPWSALTVKPGHIVHPDPRYDDSIVDEAIHAFSEWGDARRFFNKFGIEIKHPTSSLATAYLDKMRTNHDASWERKETRDRLVLLPISVLPSEIIAVGDHEGGGLNVAISGYVLDQAQYDQAIADVRSRLQHRYERKV